ncbi:pectate lyase family protein [Polaribacter sp.]|uniref:pectate lyase family protein n=1 Tax=Polaribacter sp. TaxID=1920175 RepID=UPI003F6A5B4B
MRTPLICFIALFLSFFSSAQSLSINKSGGWLESAFVEWQPVDGASSYNVYFTGAGITNRKIDNQLIRCYKDGTYRADILGLKAGSYTVSVAPIIGNAEGTKTTTNSITVLPHDRAGFAFSNNRLAGAYNFDGTPQDNAVILYITEETKDTVELTVSGANSNPCVGLQEILDGFKKGKDTRPLIIRMIGQITDPAVLQSGDIVIENKNNANSHITLEGVGEDAVADGWGIRIKNASNIEIRNIGSMNCNSNEGDNIGLQQGNDHIWVHNVDFFYGDAGGDSDQAKGDGALDCKRSKYVTFSYNHFWDSGKSNLLGLSETQGDPELLITYHHNWYDHSDSRHPRVRYYTAHVYNNYYDGNSKYGVGSTLGSSVFVENNYFRNCKYPMLTSLQGTDIISGKGTFSGEDGGSIKAFGNTIIGASRFDPYGAAGPINSTTEFDAVVTATRNETIPGSITSKKGSNTYNNFDTSDVLWYTYTPDSAEDAKTKVMQFSGRMNGGDFNWTFDQAEDDTSYSVNQPLKSALINYTTNLVCVQGVSEPPSSQTLTVSTANADQAVIDGNSIQNIVFTWGGTATDATVTGLPSSGITFVKNTNAKTITISGTPTADVTYTVATSGNSGTSTAITGNITVGTISTEDQIHNFTESGKESDFYNITGNLSTSKGDVNYNGLTLTQCLKIESSTNITFTAQTSGTLTLVFNEGVSGSIRIDGNDEDFSGGVLTLTLSQGAHTISKDVTLNLYYMSFENSSLNVEKNSKAFDIRMYPNPVTHHLNFSSDLNITKIEVYNMLGVLVKKSKNETKSVDMSNLSKATYIVKVFTDKGVKKRVIIKK